MLFRSKKKRKKRMRRRGIKKKRRKLLTQRVGAQPNKAGQIFLHSLRVKIPPYYRLYKIMTLCDRRSTRN